MFLLAVSQKKHIQIILFCIAVEALKNRSVYKIKVKDISSEVIRFTVDDSAVSFKKQGKHTMYTKEILLRTLEDHDGRIEKLLAELTQKHYCIKTPLWNNDYYKRKP